jgi:malonate transporter and related proteins
MVKTTVTALLPTIVTLLLGYAAAWHKDFDANQATVLNRMVMLYALPLALFAGMIGANRDEVLSQGPLALAIVLGMAGSFAAVFLISYGFLQRDPAIASLRALAITGPAVPFIGFSVLGFLFGKESAILISISSLAMNLIQVPATLVFL